MGAYPSWIAGIEYRSATEQLIAMNLPDGQTLDLVREEDNQYDGNAVKIMLRGYHLGYIPDRHDYVGRLLDEGNAVVCYFNKKLDGDLPLLTILTGSDVQYFQEESILLIQSNNYIKAKSDLNNIVKLSVLLPLILLCIYIVFTVINPQRTPGFDLSGIPLSIGTNISTTKDNITSPQIISNQNEPSDATGESPISIPTAPLPIARPRI